MWVYEKKLQYPVKVSIIEIVKILPKGPFSQCLHRGKLLQVIRLKPHIKMRRRSVIFSPDRRAGIKPAVEGFIGFDRRFQPYHLEQFSPMEALRKGTLWKDLYDFYDNPYRGGIEYGEKD